MPINFFFKIDETVYDCLSKSYTKIIGIHYEVGKAGYSARMASMGSIMYWVDDPYLDGARMSWEIEKVHSHEKQSEIEEMLMWW